MSFWALATCGLVLYLLSSGLAVIRKNILPQGVGCTDALGASKIHLDTWTTGACDKFTCIMRPSGNYTLEQVCRDIPSVESPDSVNCATVANNSALYPGCCPELKCSTPVLTTTTASSCGDRSPLSACTVWKQHFDGCNNATGPARILNITTVFCKHTCKFC